MNQVDTHFRRVTPRGFAWVFNLFFKSKHWVMAKGSHGTQDMLYTFIDGCYDRVRALGGCQPLAGARHRSLV